jgi:OOP family OmpA-OmpF porin
MVKIFGIYLSASFFFFTLSAYTQNLDAGDNLVKVTGYVYDSTLQTPVGGATISYEELPYGNIIGIVKTDESSGQFEFTTSGQEKYRIEVKKETYNTHIEIISPFKDAVEGEYKRDFRLSRMPDVGDVLKLEHLIFEQGKSDITEDSFSELDDLVRMMKEKPGMIIQLEGHTDFHGSRTKNMELSEDRVMAVKNYLITKGINKNRIYTKAFGGTQPVTRESTPEAARLNRRVEVRILQK